MTRKPTEKDLRERVAKMLNWTEEHTHHFSFHTLSILVELKDPELYKDLNEYISNGIGMNYFDKGIF